MTTIDNMKNKFEEIPWDNNDESLKKIKSGQKSLKCGNLAKKACNDVTTTTTKTTTITTIRKLYVLHVTNVITTNPMTNNMIAKS